MGRSNTVIRINLSKNEAVVTEREKITSGQVNMVSVKFTFSDEWKELKRLAVFTSGEITKTRELDDTNECFVPAEVTLKKGLPVLCGVYGTKDGVLVIPSVYAFLGIVEQGAEPDNDETVKTPGVIEQLYARFERVAKIADDAKTAADGVVERADSGEFDGEKGDDGKTPSYDDMTDEQKADFLKDAVTKKEFESTMHTVDLTAITVITDGAGEISEKEIKNTGSDWTNTKGTIDISGYVEIEATSTFIDTVTLTINGTVYYANGISFPDDNLISFKGNVTEPIAFEVSPGCTLLFTKFVTTTEYALRKKVAELEKNKANAADVYSKNDIDEIVLKDVDLAEVAVVTEGTADITKNTIDPTTADYSLIKGTIDVTGYVEIEAENTVIDCAYLVINGNRYESYHSAGTKISFKGNVTEPIIFEIESSAELTFTKFVATSEYILRNEIKQAVNESGHATKEEIDTRTLSNLDLTTDGLVTWAEGADFSVSKNSINNNTMNQDGVGSSENALINISGYCELEAVGSGMGGGELTINGDVYYVYTGMPSISFAGNVTEPIVAFLGISGGISFSKFKVSRIDALEKRVGDFDAALDELHTYAQALISGGAAE